MTSIDASDPIQSAFAQVLGLPSWNVQNGQGSVLTFEFGNPSLYIREPIEPKLPTSDKVVKQLRRRTIRAIGEWTLWISCCNWRCVLHGKEVAHSESADKRIAMAAHELDGQRLLSVDVNPSSGASKFIFDLGASLETSPYDDKMRHEQWSLDRRTGHIFAYSNDGQYSWSSRDTKFGEETWLPINSVSD